MFLFKKEVDAVQKIQPLLAHALELANHLPGGAEVYAYTDGEETLVVGTAGAIMAALRYGPGDRHARAEAVAEFEPIRGLAVFGDRELLLQAARTVAGLERPVPLIAEQVLKKAREAA